MLRLIPDSCFDVFHCSAQAVVSAAAVLTSTPRSVSLQNLSTGILPFTRQIYLPR